MFFCGSDCGSEWNPRLSRFRGFERRKIVQSVSPKSTKVPKSDDCSLLRLSVLFVCSAGVKTGSSGRTRTYNPSVRSRIGALPAPAQQVFCQAAIQRYRLRRRLGLAVADHLMPDGSCHIELKFVEIHILPSKHQEFADSKTCSRVEQCSDDE